MNQAIVIGAGASGLFFAAAPEISRLLKKSNILKSSNRKTVLLERQNRAGRKILLSGGGKCNITNKDISPENYLIAANYGSSYLTKKAFSAERNSAFCRKSLSAFTSSDMMSLLQILGIKTEEREHGQFFCLQDAQVFRDALVDLAKKSGAEIIYDQILSTYEKVNSSSGDFFRVQCPDQTFEGSNLVVSTGGVSWPSAGSTGLGHKIAKTFGHTVYPTSPALTPLKVQPNSPLLGLQGLSLDVKISLGVNDGNKVSPIINGPSFTLPLLFTHTGISGPATLQISSYYREGMSILIDFMPSKDISAMLDAPGNKQHLRNLLRAEFPERLTDALLQAAKMAHLAQKRVTELSRVERDSIIQVVKRHCVIPTAFGMAQAESSSGGVLTNELNSKNMESKTIAGLYFTGEVMDVCGQLGGYNLHWAWSSAWQAATSIYS